MFKGNLTLQNIIIQNATFVTQDVASVHKMCVGKYQMLHCRGTIYCIFG